MDLKGLQYFIAVIECGSFMEASRKIRIAQPSLGWQIKKLEDELGVALLTRHSRGVEATEAGLLLLEHARDILMRTSAAITQLRIMSSVPRGAVSLGVTASVNAMLTLPLLQCLAAHAVHVQLNPVEELSGVLIEWVADGRLDMAIALPVTDHPELIYEPLLSESMYFVESAKHGDPPKDQISFRQALQHDLVMTPLSPWYRSLLQETARAQNTAVKVRYHIQSLATLKDMVAQGMAATIQSYGAVMREVATGVLRASRIVEPEMTRNVCLVLKRTKPMSDAATTVREHVVQLVNEMIPKSPGKWGPFEDDQPATPSQLNVDGIARRRYQEANEQSSRRPAAKAPRVSPGLARRRR